MSTSITLAVILDEQLARMLPVSSSPSFITSQASRFEVLHTDGGPAPFSSKYRAGTMSWFDTTSDAYLYRAYEQSLGFHTVLLGDLTDYAESSLVVLSSRPWPHPATQE